MHRPRRTKKGSERPAEAPRAVIYARVSSKEQEEGYSIDAQLALLRGYAAGKGLEVIAECVEAETAKSTGRPQFARMVALLKQGTAVVIVEKTDRLYRNLKDRVTLDETGAEIHLVKESTVLGPNSKSHEKFIHDIKVVVAKNYIDNLSEEVKKGMTEKARQGLYPSSAPYGYRNVIAAGQRIIEPDPAIAPGVVRLFESYAKGEVSLARLGVYATLLGLRSRKGNPLHHSTVQYILTNPIYMGDFDWDGHRYEGSHEPIITRELWLKVQGVMNRRTQNEPRAKREFTYSGLVRCAVCGCVATPYEKKGKYVYYACSGARGCRRVGIREERLHEAICGLLDGLLIHPALLDALRAGFRDLAKEQGLEHRGQIDLLMRRREELTAKLERLYCDRVAGNVGEGTYSKLMGEWSTALDEVNTAISQHDRANVATWDDNVCILEMVSNCSNRFKTAQSARKREIAKWALSNFSIQDGNAVLELRPWFKMLAAANATATQNGPQTGTMRDWWAIVDAIRMAQAA